MKTNMYIDGGYIGKIIKQSDISVDLNKLCHLLSEGDEVQHIYYYNCLPWLSEKSPPEEMVLFNKVQRFYNILAKQPKFTVKLGKLARFNGIFVQKGVDTMIAVDMTTAAMNKEVDRFILVSGDSDFVCVLQSIIKLGCKVTVWKYIKNDQASERVFSSAIGYNNVRILNYDILTRAERRSSY